MLSWQSHIHLPFPAPCPPSFHMFYPFSYFQTSFLATLLSLDFVSIVIQPPSFHFSIHFFYLNSFLFLHLNLLLKTQRNCPLGSFLWYPGSQPSSSSSSFLFHFFPALSLCFSPLFSLSSSDLGYLHVFPNGKEFWYITTGHLFIFLEAHLIPLQEKLEKGNISVSERLFLRVVLQRRTFLRGPLTHKNSSRGTGQLEG